MAIDKLLSEHNSEPQNFIIANVLYKSEVLESWGCGINLMIYEYRRVSIPNPEFHTDGSAAWVVFHCTRNAVGKNPTVTPQVNAIVNVISYKLSSVKEIMEIAELKDGKSFLYGYLYPAIESLAMTAQNRFHRPISEQDTQATLASSSSQCWKSTPT